MSPFHEDEAVCRVAESLGLSLSRYESVEISEADARAAGMMRESVDYGRIRKALRDGGTVQGAKVGGVEYRLRRLA
jgi:hypothetical protein